MSFDIDWPQLFKTTGVILVVFMMVGGIVSQTTHGVSGAGFKEGMWKGVEWFFIALVAVVVVVAVVAVMGNISNAINAQ